MADYAKELFSGGESEKPPAGDYAKELFSGEEAEPVGGSFRESRRISTITGKSEKEFTPMSGGEASFLTLMKASLADDHLTKAKIFAEARGIPIFRYRVGKAGHVEYKDEEGNWQRETSEMPTSKLRNFAAEVLGNPGTYVGPLLAARGARGWGIKPGFPGAAAGGAAGEMMRKGAGASMGDEPKPAADLLDVGMNSVFALAGEGVGKILGGAANKLKNTSVKQVIGAEEGPGALMRGGTEIQKGVLTPAEHAKALWLQKLADQHGMTLAPHQLYDRQGMVNMWKYLRSHPVTSDQVRQIEDRLGQATNKEIEEFIKKMGGYEKSPYQIGTDLRDASEEVIVGREKARTKHVQPIYEEAFDQAERVGGIDISSSIQRLQGMIEGHPEGITRDVLEKVKKSLTRVQADVEGSGTAAGKTVASGPVQPKGGTLIGWIRKKGMINPRDWKGEFGPKDTGVVAMSSSEGRGLDELMSQAADDGWILPGMSEKEFVNLIKRDVRSAKTGGQRVLKTGDWENIQAPEWAAKVEGKEVKATQRTPDTDLRRVQKAIFDLNDLIEGTSYEASKIAPSSKKFLNRELTELKTGLIAQIAKVAPEFPIGNAAYSYLSPPIDNLKKSVIGEMTRMQSDAVTSRASHKVLDVANMPDPVLVARARMVIEPENPDLWRRMVGSFIRDNYEGLLVTEEGRVVNAAGKLQKRLFGSEKQKQIMQAAMTKEQFSEFSDLMTLFQRAAVGSGKESMTAPFQQIEKQLAGGMGSHLYDAVSHPQRTVADWMFGRWNDLLLADRQGQLLEALTAPDAVKRISEMKKLSPGSKKLIEGLSVLGAMISEKRVMKNRPDKGGR